MSEPARLPHLQRPLYQNPEPASSNPAPRPALREQKIQTETLPRPLFRFDEKIESFTSTGHLPPPVDSLYTVHEQGVSNPRILRMTQNVIPLDHSTNQSTGLPICAIWQPIAELPEHDDEVGTSDSVPFRCSRCGGYISSFFKFVESGRKIICNICGMSMDTPELYMSDRAGRAELHMGTYDFKAPALYSSPPSHPHLFLLVVEISQGALELGLMSQVVSSIQAILDYIPHPDRTLIGIIAYDLAIHLFKVTPAGELCETVVNDVEDPFIPDSVNSVCFNVMNDREGLDRILDKLANFEFKAVTKQTLSPAAVLLAVKEYLLKMRGGRVLFFSSQPGATGKLALGAKSDVKFVNTEKEKGYLPAENHIPLAQECSVEGICVDIFSCSSQPMNSSSLAYITSQTGGDYYHFPNYRPETDGEKIYYLITRILTRPQITQVLMRARCSNGLSVDYYVGKFKRKGPVEMEVAALDADKTITVVIKYDEKLNESNEYYVQCAMLYTNYAGERLIRVANGKVLATKNLGLVFKSADMDACNTAMFKIGANKVFEAPLNEVRDYWHSNIIKLLIAHRTHLSDFDFSKVLVPETLKLLPLYCNSSLKLPALTTFQVPTDSRLSSLHQVLGLPILQCKLLTYPRIYAIHNIEDQAQETGLANSNGLISLPTLIGSSIEFLKPSGVYLINNGERLIIFIGKETNETFIQQVWGMNSVQELFENPEYWTLQDLENEINARVLAVIEEIRRRTPGCYLPLGMFFEGHSDLQVMKLMLLEDNNSSELAYGDFLMRLHRVVSSKMRKDS